MAYKMCPIKETVVKLAYFGKVLIGQYQTGVEEIMVGECS